LDDVIPDSCTFQITETLDNDGGNDLNLNTGDIQADSAYFNSLNIQAGSSAGKSRYRTNPNRERRFQ